MYVLCDILCIRKVISVGATLVYGEIDCQQVRDEDSSGAAIAFTSKNSWFDVSKGQDNLTNVYQSDILET